MPAAKTAATASKLAPSAAESSAASRVRRVRLSKALAAKPAAKPASTTPPATRPKANGAKPKKPKLLSNRYKIPDNEYARLTALKQRLLLLGTSARRSELLRAGLMLLVALDDAQLKKAVANVEVIKSRRSPQKTT